MDIKGNKEAIDEEIVSLFHQVRRMVEEREKAAAAAAVAVTVPKTEDPPQAANGNGTATSSKRKRSTSLEEPPESSPAHPISKDKRSKELTDEDLARQLHAEMNRVGARTTRGGSSGSAAKKAKVGTKKGKKAVKSEATVNDSDGEGDAPKKKRAVSNTGFNKLMKLSPQLQDILGVDQLSRPQVVKQLWVHIKANNLQDPNARTEIICDEKMRILFKSPRVNSFKMNKLITSHLFPADS